jgi:hypothetical protein
VRALVHITVCVLLARQSSAKCGRCAKRTAAVVSVVQPSRVGPRGRGWAKHGSRARAEVRQVGARRYRRAVGVEVQGLNAAKAGEAAREAHELVVDVEVHVVGNTRERLETVGKGLHVCVVNDVKVAVDRRQRVEHVVHRRHASVGNVTAIDRVFCESKEHKNT